MTTDVAHKRWWQTFEVVFGIPYNGMNPTYDERSEEQAGYANNGYHPLAAYKRSLTPQGIYVMVGGTPAQIFQAMILGNWLSENEGII